MNPQEKAYADAGITFSTDALPSGDDGNGTAPDAHVEEKKEIESKEVDKKEPEGTIDFNELLKDKKFTKETLLERLERAEKFTPELEAEIPVLRGHKKTLEEKQAEWEAKQSDFDIDETLFRLNAIKKKNPEKFDTYRKLAFMSDKPTQAERLELIKEDYLLTNPELAENKRAVDLYLRKKYPTLHESEPDVESDEYITEETALLIDSKAARTKLMQDFNAIEPFKAMTEEQKKAKIEKEQADANSEVMATVATWTPFIKSVKESKLAFDVTFKDKSDNIYSLVEESDFTPEVKEKYLRSAINDVVGRGNVKYSKETEKEIVQYMRDSYFLDNRDALLSRFAEKLAADWHQKLHNHKSVANNDVRPNSSGDEDARLLKELQNK